MTVHVNTGGKETPEGPSVVFIHGAGMDHTVWRFQTRWLANRGWRVLAPDLPGHGRSAGPIRRSIPQWAEWLTRFVEERDAAPAVLVGHSMGALIALEAAADRPPLVDRLVLVGFTSRMAVHPQLMDAAHRDALVAAELIAGWSMPRAAAGGHPEPGTWERGGIARLLQRAQPGVLAIDLEVCASYDAGARLGDIEVPVTLISGNDDRMTPTRGAREAARELLNARFVALGAGHEPMIHHPRAFNELLAEAMATDGKLTGR